MYALPPRLDSDRGEVTGMVCPDCGGVLSVRTEGRDQSLVFECRVTHTYDVAELLTAKEERTEFLLWQVTTAFEELARLLSDLADRGADHGEPPAARDAYRERAEIARSHALSLQNLLRTNRPVDLSRSQPETR